MRKLNVVFALSLTATALLVQDAPASAAPTVATTPKTLKKPTKKITDTTIPDLSVQETLDLLGMTIKAEFTEDQLLEPTILSVRKPYVDEHTAIVFLYVNEIWPTVNRAVMGEYQSPDITFRSAPGQGYVVDCKVAIDYKVKKLSVVAWATPTVGTGGTKTIYDADVLVQKRRVAFVLQPNGLNRIEIGMWAPGDSWYDFQGCKITPVKL
jgi:hypothetical protein